MRSALMELAEEFIAEELDAREHRGMVRGRTEGKAEGKAENILELLEDCGEVSKELQVRIMSERDFDVLKRWLKLAARAATVDEFKMAM